MTNYTEAHKFLFQIARQFCEEYTSEGLPAETLVMLSELSHKIISELEHSGVPVSELIAGKVFVADP